MIAGREKAMTGSGAAMAEQIACEKSRMLTD